MLRRIGVLVVSIAHRNGAVGLLCVFLCDALLHVGFGSSGRNGDVVEILIVAGGVALVMVVTTVASMSTATPVRRAAKAAGPTATAPRRP